jgi:G3E family GTPase
MLPEIEHMMALDNVITVVDAEQFPGLVRGEMAPLARMQVRDADMVVLNKVDLVDGQALAVVKTQVHEIAPRLRIIDATHGRIPLNLIMGSALHAAHVRPENAFRIHAGPCRRHPFASWHWTSDQPLSLPKLRSAIEGLPDTIYRAKGIVYLEELPSHQVVLQMVGKRYHIGDTEPWGALTPRSEIVMIGSHDGIHNDTLQHVFNDCIGSGDESQSPILRLARLLATDTRGGN